MVNRPLLALTLLTFAVIVARDASAQSPLSSDLRGLPWGASEADVLQLHADAILEEYRADIAGLRDPIEVDRRRRATDQRIAAVRDSRIVFDGERTGYEVSVVANEVGPGRTDSMLVVREDTNLRYYLFRADRLERLIVAYDQASMNFVGFEAFVERIEAVFGGPLSTDWRVDDIGVRHMTRATWNDGVTRVRAEDRSQMFATFLLVYGDVTQDDVPLASATEPSGGVARPGGTRNLGALMQTISTTDQDSGHAGVVDDLLGAPTEVELQIRQEAVDAVAQPVEAAADGEGSGEPAPAAPRPSRAAPQPTQPAAPSGEVIY